MPYVRLKDNRNTTITRYISQSPSGIVFNKAAATNFATPALARSYMNGAYPAVIVNNAGWFQNQEYVLEDGGYTITNAAVIPDPVITEYLYDERFTIDRAAPFVSNTPFAASNTGNSKAFNVGTDAAIASSKLSWSTGSPSLMFMDAGAARAKLNGRCHYVRWGMLAGATDFQSLIVIAMVGESPADNWWALGEGEPGLLFKGGAAGFGDYRNLGHVHDSLPTYTFTQGNYQKQSAVVANKVYEAMMVERTNGCFVYVREYNVDAEWEMIYLEAVSSGRAGKLQIRNISCTGVDGFFRLATANTDLEITPLVQHGFASVVSPSDGTGQDETGGDGKVATTSGAALEINSGKVRCSEDGTGLCFFETNEADICVYAELQPYDGSKAGIIFRVQDASNYLGVRIDSADSDIELYRVVAGVETSIATTDFATTDAFNLAEGVVCRLQVHTAGDAVRASFGDGSLHRSYVQGTVTHFNTATKHGVMVSRGVAVNSSTADRFAVYNQYETLPDFTL